MNERYKCIEEFLDFNLVSSNIHKRDLYLGALCLSKYDFNEGTDNIEEE